MALGRMNPAYSHAPQMMFAAGYAVFPAYAGVNTVLAQARNATTAAANGAAIGQSTTLGPDARVAVVWAPTAAYASQVASGGGLQSVVMLDCRQFQADIINADATYISPPGGTPGALTAPTGTLYCLGIDNANKFLYFGLYGVTGAGYTNILAGASMQWSVAFKDITAV